MLLGCNKKETILAEKINSVSNSIEYSKSLSIEKQNGYSIVKVSNAWPEANKDFTYILKEKNGIVPDSLQKYPTITVP